MIAPLVALRRSRSRRLHSIKKKRLAKKYTLNPRVSTGYVSTGPSEDVAQDVVEKDDTESVEMTAPAASQWLRAVQQAPLPLQLKKPQTQVFKGLREKLSLEERVNVAVGPKSPEFLEIEEYFMSVLRGTQMTIEQILESAFDLHEIALLMPTTHPPKLVQWQKENARLYRDLLETRFKGHLPLLQFKLTLLWFGLPVEPMRPGAQPVPMPVDIDYENDDTVIEHDPLSFLNDYTERSEGGYRPNSDTASQASTPFLSLRGGGLSDDDAMEVDDDSGNEATDEATWATEIRVWGFQGSILMHNMSYGNFVTAASQVLGLEQAYTYEICLEIWDSTGNVKKTALQATEGKVYNDIIPSHESDPIYSLLHKWFYTTQPVTNTTCFVHFKNEGHPNFYTPDPVNNPDVVRLFDSTTKNMSWMKVPEKLHRTHRPHQFSQEYQRAMRLLFPENPHKFFIAAKDPKRGLTYGVLDPAPGIWPVMCAEQKDPDGWPLISFSRVDIPYDVVPILVPGFNNYTTEWPSYSLFSTPSSAEQSSKTQCFRKGDFKMVGTDQDRLGLLKVFHAVAKANSGLDPPQPGLLGVDVWVDYESFLALKGPSGRIDAADFETGSRPLADWRSIATSWRGARAHHPLAKLSMVVRPVFTDYTVASRQGQNRTVIGMIDDLSLDGFRALVQTNLYHQYDSRNKAHVLHLSQITWGVTQLDFVIRAETKPQDWAWILRNITEPDLIVALEDWGNEWALNTTTEWGPRYEGEDLKKLSAFEALKKPAPYSTKTNDIFRHSKNTQASAGRSQQLRERFFWDTPSLFTNPSKPAMPIHGPPIESIVRTGPAMPGVSIAMLTPTEVARLQREVHSLRNQLLDRVRECPFADCARYFRFGDGAGLDLHLREDHKTLQCFLCSKKEHLMPFYSQDQIRQHFLEEHGHEMKELFGYVRPRPRGAPASVGTADDASQANKGPEDQFCNRCGRDESILHDEGDRSHHAAWCFQLQEDQPDTRTCYCVHCGRVRTMQNSTERYFEECECGLEPQDYQDPGDFCALCKLDYNHHGLSRGYRELHRQLCRPLSGGEWDFCPYCGVSLEEESVNDRLTHGLFCEKKPPGKPPQLAAAPPPPPPKVADGKIAAGPIEKRCKNFHFCGALVTHMSKKQLKAHFQSDELIDPSKPQTHPDLARRPSRPGPIQTSGDTPTPLPLPVREDPPKLSPELPLELPPVRSPERETGGPQGENMQQDILPSWREAKPGEKVGKRREPEAAWHTLIKTKHPAKWQPEAAARCSRCFRPAGTNKKQIEGHMDSAKSCQIRRGYGMFSPVGLPNRSGWIRPSTNIDFAETYSRFVTTYPAYRYTMFPVRAKNVGKTWQRSNAVKCEPGAFKDDPNYEHGDTEHDQNASRMLPWPPYEGFIIPLYDGEVQKSQDTGNTGADGTEGSGLDSHSDEGENDSDISLEGSEKGFVPFQPATKNSGNASESSDNDPFRGRFGNKESGSGNGNKGFVSLKPTSKDSGIGSSSSGSDFFKDKFSKKESGRDDADSGSKGFVSLTEVLKAQEESGQGTKPPLSKSSGTAEVGSAHVLQFFADGGPLQMPGGTSPLKTAGRAHKRKRKRSIDDPTFEKPSGRETEPEEEHSEASAVPDPISNLDPDAPPTPKKLATKKKNVKKSVARSTAAVEIAAQGMAAARAAAVAGRKAPLKSRVMELAGTPAVSMPPPTAIATAAPTTSPEPATKSEPKTPGRRAKEGAPATRVTVTRTGRPIRATRAAMEAAATSYAESTTEDSEVSAPKGKGKGKAKGVATSEDGEFDETLAKTPATVRRGRSKK